LKKWRRLKDDNLVVVSSSNFPSVRGAVDTADPNVVVVGSWDDLHSLEGAGQNNDIAPSGIRLKTREQTHTLKSIAFGNLPALIKSRH